MFLCGICSGDGWASDSIDNYSPADQVFAPLELGSYKATLRKNGYDVNDVNDIILATTNTKPLVRIKARALLAHKIGPEAIPVIKPGLDESHPYQRISTARLLGILGDKSGLERLRKDLAELKKDNQEKNKDGMDSQKNQRNEHISMWMRKFCELEAARVLAEFGDTSVFDLAAEAALKSKSSMRRIQGISTLAELGRIDKAELQAKGCDPKPIFLAIAESETNEFVLTSLKNCVQTTMKPGPVVRILEKLKDSPYLSEKERRLTERGIRHHKKRIEKEKKKSEETENQEQNEAEENRK
jgi:hypothetical protein